MSEIPPDPGPGAHPPTLLEAAAALRAGRVAVCELLLRKHLVADPTDVAALRMLAEVAFRLGRHADAEALLHRCLEFTPDLLPARCDLALVLHRQNEPVRALAEVDLVLAKTPGDAVARNLKAAILASIGEFDQSLTTYADLLAGYPDNARAWLTYGHALKTAGRLAEGVAAYRRSIELAPGLGEAWWSLANLKTWHFGAADIAAMEGELAREGLTDEDQLHFHFALGKALEDDGRYRESFGHYSRGNALRRAAAPWNAERNTASVRRTRSVFTMEFFRQRAGWGAGATDPIFIVGLPRSGSTLVEQVLASHSAVEGTMELHDIVTIARSLLEGRAGDEPAKVLDLVARFDAPRARALGELYLERTRVQRKRPARHFIDKLPNNWMRVGLIHLVLPNARIIDARRDAMSCCFSCFKQHFARGQDFAYDLADLGRYYRDYVELMAHFDTVLPGRIHRVRYEAMVEDTEAEVRRLLEYCGLPFEDACLRFYENERAVRTPSSEQVRTPIFRDGLAQWRNYEPWLEPLRVALGEFGRAD